MSSEWDTPWDAKQENPTPPAPPEQPEEDGPPDLGEPVKGRISATVKGGNSYRSPWLVFEADTAPDLERLLSQGMDAGLHVLTARAARAFWSQNPEDQVQPRQGGGGGGQRQPVQQLPPGVQQKRCDHGDMTFRTGTSSKGPWQGFFCPKDRNDPGRCKPIYL